MTARPVIPPSLHDGGKHRQQHHALFSDPQPFTFHSTTSFESNAQQVLNSRPLPPVFEPFITHFPFKRTLQLPAFDHVEEFLGC